MTSSPDIDAEMNEAELEALLSPVIKNAFPFLEPTSIRHQLQFSVQLGAARHEIDGRGYKSRGRLDILLKHKGKPLAIMELKRPDVTLTDDDKKQGLSYARLIEPMAPLVIITNGNNTALYETISGNKWQPSTADESAFQSLVERSAQIAASDIQEAIATLLGPTSHTLRVLLSSLSSTYIGDLTGDWNDNMAPFPKDLMFPRKLSSIIWREFAKSTRFIVVSGPPLIGKSNILKEVFEYSATRAQAIVLLLEGSAIRQGLFRFLSDIFSMEFGWNITPEDARQWVMRISHNATFRLILAIDDADPELLGADLDSIASPAFGGKLQVLLGCDTGSSPKFTQSRNGRQKTPLGRQSVELDVKRLDDDEFGAALNILDEKRIQFLNGAERSDDYRAPWVLRAIASDVVESPNYTDSSKAAAIPSIPGLMLLDFAQRRFLSNEELRARYSAFADAVLEDVEEMDRALGTALISGFVCRRSTLLKYISEGELSQALRHGELKIFLMSDDIRGVAAQIPELAALAISRRIGGALAAKVDDENFDIASFVNPCSRIPLGDVIGAFALVEAAKLRGGIPTSVLTALVQRAPKRESFSQGQKLSMMLGGETFRVDVGQNGKLYVISPDGGREALDENSDLTVKPLIGDITPWMILSYLAAMPLLAVDPTGDVLGSLDTSVLAEVATAPHMLRLPMRSSPDGVLTHDLPDGTSIVCHNEGIIEPITLALMQAALHDRARGEHLVDLAKQKRSEPLSMRLYTAFNVIAHLDGVSRAAWARALVDREILPMIKGSPAFH